MRFFLLSLLFCAVLADFSCTFLAGVQGCTGNSVDWFNVACWSTGALPGVTDDVLIDGTTFNIPTPVTVVLNQQTIVNSITLQNGGSLNIAGVAQITTSITMNGGVLNYFNAKPATAYSIILNDGSRLITGSALTLASLTTTGSVTIDLAKNTNVNFGTTGNAQLSGLVNITSDPSVPSAILTWSGATTVFNSKISVGNKIGLALFTGTFTPTAAVPGSVPTIDGKGLLTVGALATLSIAAPFAFTIPIISNGIVSFDRGTQTTRPQLDVSTTSLTLMPSSTVVINSAYIDKDQNGNNWVLVKGPISGSDFKQKFSYTYNCGGGGFMTGSATGLTLTTMTGYSGFTAPKNLTYTKINDKSMKLTFNTLVDKCILPNSVKYTIAANGWSLNQVVQGPGTPDAQVSVQIDNVPGGSYQYTVTTAATDTNNYPVSSKIDPLAIQLAVKASTAPSSASVVAVGAAAMFVAALF